MIERSVQRLVQDAGLLFHPDTRVKVKDERVVNRFLDLQKALQQYLTDPDIKMNQLIGKVSRPFSTDQLVGTFYNVDNGSIHVVSAMPKPLEDIPPLIEDMRVIGNTLDCISYGILSEGKNRNFPLKILPDSLVTVSVEKVFNDSHLQFKMMAIGNQGSFPKAPFLPDFYKNKKYITNPVCSIFTIPVDPETTTRFKRQWMEGEIDRAGDLMAFVQKMATMSMVSAVRNKTIFPRLQK